MQIKKENAIVAWHAGCRDVRKVLENLFPTIEFKIPKKYHAGDVILIPFIIKDARADDDDIYPYEVEPLVGAFEADGEKVTNLYTSEETLDGGERKKNS